MIIINEMLIFTVYFYIGTINEVQFKRIFYNYTKYYSLLYIISVNKR